MEPSNSLYKQLKQCNSITELYQVLGEERLKKGVFLLLCGWALVPIASVFSHFFGRLERNPIEYLTNKRIMLYFV